MEINLTNKQKYIIITILIVILLTILTAIYIVNTQLSNKIETDQDSSIKFTGYSEAEISKEKLNEVNQNRDLRKQSPYTGNGFKIVYSYDTFKYEIYLSQPYDQSRINFNSFIDSNFFNIPQEKFIYIEE